MTSQWIYNESAIAGVDYSDNKIAADYDNQHTKFRDYEKTALRVIDALKIKSDDVVIDMGCGTGAFAITAARRCKKVYAVDISQAMLDFLAQKAEKENLTNIETKKAGFLSYEHKGEKPDAVASFIALHHLPDFWKSIAIKKIYDILKPGGKFFLLDVVFSFPVSEYRQAIDNWLLGMKMHAGEQMMEEGIVHIRDEYSTWDWILENMFRISGFEIQSKQSEQPNTQAYVCVKK